MSVDGTADVVTVKFAAVAPPATVTLDGTPTLALLELRLTTSPPVGAALESATVPVAECPPITELGDTEMPTRPGASMVRIALRDVPA